MKERTRKRIKFRERAAERLLAIDKGRVAYMKFFQRAGVDLRPLTPAEKRMEVL